jgi:hypothetical protein
MRDTRWIADEARLWFQFMDAKSYWIPKPSKKHLASLPSKKRQKVLQKYEKQRAEKLAAGWQNYNEFIRH